MNLDEAIEEARPLLQALLGPDRFEAHVRLVPHMPEYEQIFTGHMAGIVRRAYEFRPIMPLESYAKPEQTEILIGGSLAETLGTDPAASPFFANGWKWFLPHLVPGRMWLGWKYVKKGARLGMAYDGLVRVDKRWVWVPKPWRVVEMPTASAAENR